MHTKQTPRADDDSDRPDLTYGVWVQTLTDSTRAALLALPSPRRSDGSPRRGDEASRDAPSLSDLLAVVTEVRDLLVNQRQARDHYSTEEAAQILGKAG